MQLSILLMGKDKQRQRQSPKRLSIKCGKDLLGHVTITGCDNFWSLGSFTPGPDFERYRKFFEREQALSQQAAEAADEEYVAASDASLDAIEQINELGLRIGEDDEPVWDFKIDQESQVEFKIWPDRQGA